MEEIDKQVEYIIVMGEAQQRLKTLCRIYREIVLEDETMDSVPLEAKQFASAESLARSFMEIARRFNYPQEKVLQGLMENFVLPLMVAVHGIAVKDFENKKTKPDAASADIRSEHEDNR